MGHPTVLPTRDFPALAIANGENINRNAIEEQLARLLASPLFTSSKRYPGLLRYVVEYALNNPGSDLKERTIGIEVFGREPSYDTNHDPVVRTSAVEVRKRLIQYYQDAAHTTELRIELLVGSYLPRFHGGPASALVQPKIETPFEVSETHQGDLPWRALATGVALIAVAALLWFRPWSASSDNLFWDSIWNTPDPVLIGLSGGPGPPPPGGAQNDNAAALPQNDNRTLSDLFRARVDYVAMGDATAMARILSNPGTRGKTFSVTYNSSIQLADLKKGPAILIGPMSRWLEMMSKDLRFTIDRDQAVTQSWVSDRQNPASRQWAVQVGAPASSVAEAYALVSRVWNPTTGKFMVCISGLSPYATSATGDFVSDPRKMDELLKNAPSGWSRKNVQIVIAATRVGTNVGIPRAAATYFW